MAETKLPPARSGGAEDEWKTGTGRDSKGVFWTMEFEQEIFRIRMGPNGQRFTVAMKNRSQDNWLIIGFADSVAEGMKVALTSRKYGVPAPEQGTEQ